MSYLRKKLENSPELLRIAPFAVYGLAIICQGSTNESRYYWTYIAKTIIAAWVIWEIRPLVKEMRWKISWEAVIIGIVIFVLWVGLDAYYPRLSEPGPGATPFEHFGASSATAWFYIVIHILGMTFIVPPTEELFYRSFLYRYFVNTNFLEMPLGQYHALSFFLTSIIFGLVHAEWVPGIICGLAYQWLVIRKNRLGDAMTAHAITNCLLGLWIVWKHDWRFW